jgi:hypothetical protein
MAIQSPDNARTHLERLGTVLQRRGWRVHLLGGDRRTELQVTNPDTPAFNEVIWCRRMPDGEWTFWWPWREPIGTAERVNEVADRIAHVLRATPDEVTEAAKVSEVTE